MTMATLSPDAALAAFRKAYGEVADTNVLLRAHIAEVEAENERLRAQAPPEAQPEPETSHGPETGAGAPSGDQAMR